MLGGGSTHPPLNALSFFHQKEERNKRVREREGEKNKKKWQGLDSLRFERLALGGSEQQMPQQQSGLMPSGELAP